VRCPHRGSKPRLGRPGARQDDDPHAHFVRPQRGNARLTMSRGTPPPVKGRGPTFNPGNRFRREGREAFDDGWSAPAPETVGGIDDAVDDDAPPPLKTTVSIQASRT